MTKRQLIDEIIHINQTAEPGFLSQLEDQDLREYLDHLHTARTPRMVGEAGRYEKYFAARPVPLGNELAVAPPAEFGLGNSAVSTETDAAERAALLAVQPPPEVDAEAEEQAESAQPVAVAAAPVAKATDNVVCPNSVQTTAPAAQAPAVSEETPVEESHREAERDPLDSDADDESAAEEDLIEDDLADEEAEEPTTRRDSVTARIARAWRQAPQDDQDEVAASQLDVAAEPSPQDSAADSQVETEEDSAPSAPADKGVSDHAEPAAVIAGGDKSEEPQNWLF